jgi:microcompartment protein CcmL/EutN
VKFSKTGNTTKLLCFNGSGETIVTTKIIRNVPKEVQAIVPKRNEINDRVSWVMHSCVVSPFMARVPINIGDKQSERHYEVLKLKPVIKHQKISDFLMFDYRF